MSYPREKDWDFRYTGSWEQVHAALLMDIRAELRMLNRVFRCENALAIPHLLRDIKRNTTKKRRKRTREA